MSLVETTVQDGIAEIRLARPPVNAMNPELCLAVREALDAAIGAGAQGIILGSSAKVFSAGLDVPHLVSLGQDHDALRSAWQAFFDTALALANAPVPVVAALSGHAPAGGCVWALCCDYRVMASGPFRVGLNETQVGLVAPEGIQRLMRRIVGPHRAERLLVSGEMVEAEQALAYGLVDELVDVDSVATRARVWLEQLLTLPRDAMLATRAIARADVVDALQPHNIQLGRFVDAWFADGTQAALRALLAKLGK